MSPRQDRIKAGKPERLEWPGACVQLSWEPWGGVRPLRAMWLVEVEFGGWSGQGKQAFDDFDEAVEAFDKIKRKYATDIAMKALRIRRQR